MRSSAVAGVQSLRSRRSFWPVVVCLLALSALIAFARYGRVPPAPAVGDEVIINDASLSLAQGHGLRAVDFGGDEYGLDRLFAHFPPLYPLTEAFAFRVFGFSVYSLRLTATLMSLAATLVFLLLCGRLYGHGELSYGAAALLGAVYCTWAPLLILQRIARMEPMISVLVLLAFSLLVGLFLWPAAQASRARWLLAGLCTGLCMAVHPEAVTAVVFFLPLYVLAPGTLWEKAGAAVVAVFSPVLVWVAVFQSQSLFALRQFRQILHNTPVEARLHNLPGLLVGSQGPERLAFPMFLLSVAVLAAALPVAAFFLRRRGRNHLGEAAPADVRLAGTYASGLQSAFALSGILVLLMMEFALHLNVRRYEFLFGPLLFAAGLLVLGRRPPGRAVRAGAALVIASQLAVLGFYLFPSRARAARTDPYRFMPMVAELPASWKVAAIPDFWVDFETAHRPIQLVYLQYDGRTAWSRNSDAANPLERFDAIVVIPALISNDPWLLSHLSPRWAEVRSVLGGEDVVIYLPHLRPSASPYTSVQQALASQ